MHIEYREISLEGGAYDSWGSTEGLTLGEYSEKVGRTPSLCGYYCPQYCLPANTTKERDFKNPLSHTSPFYMTPYLEPGV